VEFESVRGLRGVKQSEVTINGSTIRIAVATAWPSRERCWRKSAPPASAGREPPLHSSSHGLPRRCIAAAGSPTG